MQLGIGVIDSKFKNQQWTSPEQKNIVYYWGNGGIVRGEGKGLIKRRGNTVLKEGDIISVSVCQASGLIEWRINGTVE